MKSNFLSFQKIITTICRTKQAAIHSNTDHATYLNPISDADPPMTRMFPLSSLLASIGHCLHGTRIRDTMYRLTSVRYSIGGSFVLYNFYFNRWFYNHRSVSH